jgi:hypothetical protein
MPNVRRVGVARRRITLQQMERSVRRALQQLLAEEAFLLAADVAERAIAAKLGEYLAVLFPDHKVDVEYNRHGLDVKIVNLPPCCRGGGRRRIFPDIIIHQRGHDNANLLVIQIKKDTNQEPRDCDRAIIRAMKRYFRYRRGLLIDLPTGEGAGESQPTLEWF